jgi:hypothetical protein
MQTKPKANSVVTHSMQDGKIVFNVLGAGSFTFDLDKASAENRARAMVHGFVQRISDGAARLRDTKTGQSAQPSEKLAMMQRIAEHYMSGAIEWRLTEAAPAKRGVDAGLVIMAMIRALAGVGDVEAAEAIFAKQVALGKFPNRDAAIKAWSESRQVADAMKVILAERAAAQANLDADAMLAELGMGDGDAGDDEEGDEPA